MVKLTEDMVAARAKTSDMESITKLNFWGSDLTDIFLVQQFKRATILSFSLNMITTLADFQFCACLCELYIRRNNIQNLREVCYLQELPKLKHLLMSENPCCQTAGDLYRPTVLRALPNLEVLDNQEVTPLELEFSLQLGLILEHPRKDKDKPIVPGTKYYEGPIEDNSRSKYEDMMRQRGLGHHSSNLRVFVSQEPANGSKTQRPATATIPTMQTHKDNDNFPFSRQVTGHRNSALLHYPPTPTNVHNGSPILEFYRNDFSRQNSQPRRRISTMNNLSKDLQYNNNNLEYRASPQSLHSQKNTNIVSAALLLFSEMNLEELYAVEDAIRTRIHSQTQSLG